MEKKTIHARGTESFALCGNDTSLENVGTDAAANCWECRSIID